MDRQLFIEDSLLLEAGTYVKLQDAYFAEQNAAGSWRLIGYTGPGESKAWSSTETSNFAYDGSAISSTVTASQANAWKATANVALNDCVKGSIWSITVDPSSTTDGIKFKVPALATACVPLTPNFCKIATSGNCEN